MHLVQRFSTLWYLYRRIVVSDLSASCRAIRTRITNTVGDGVVQSRHFGWQPALELTCDQMRCPGSKGLLFFPKLKKIHEKTQNFLTTRMLSARHMAGWKTKNNNYFTTGSHSQLWRNAGPSAFQLQVSMLKSDKIWSAYLIVNCVSLRTFWTPLVP